MSVHLIYAPISCLTHVASARRAGAFLQVELCAMPWERRCGPEGAMMGGAKWECIVFSGSMNTSYNQWKRLKVLYSLPKIYLSHYSAGFISESWASQVHPRSQCIGRLFEPRGWNCSDLGHLGYDVEGIQKKAKWEISQVFFQDTKVGRTM